MSTTKELPIECQVRLNDERQVYIMPSGDGGCGCWGYENAFNETETLAKRLRAPDLMPSKDEYGTLAVYEKHRKAIAMVENKGLDLGIWFDPKTTRSIRQILQWAYDTEEPIRLFYGDIESGRDYMEEDGVVGRIGRSTGTLKIPLLIANNDYGGGGIQDACIVRIMRVDNGEELYRHPKYHHAEVEIVKNDDPETSEYTHAAKVDGEIHARFKKAGDAYAWAAFITGEVVPYPPSLAPEPEEGTHDRNPSPG